MVRYYFICSNNHTFDAWFKNIEFFEEQFKTEGNIICPICGSVKIAKQISAASMVAGKGKTRNSIKKSNSITTTDVHKLNNYLTKLRSYVENNFSYVGANFKDVALKMHKGEVEKDNIYGEANAEEIEELIQEGIDIMPLPIKDFSNKIN